jgi:hypothetical protein
MKSKILVAAVMMLSIQMGFGQTINKQKGKIIVSRLMDSLWIHPSGFINHNDPNWIRLNQHLENVDVLQMNELIHSVYYVSNSFP